MQQDRKEAKMRQDIQSIKDVRSNPSLGYRQVDHALQVADRLIQGIVS